MMNNTKKKVMALATAGLIVFSTTTAFANEGSEDLGLEVVTETNTNVDTELENITNEENEVATEEPAVLPGSIFYFVKTAFEKIRLALTFEDAKEAELLATYAQERLKEAEALFKDGQEDKALQTIYDALKNLENADEMVDEEKTDEESRETAEPVTEESQDTQEPADTEETTNDETNKETDSTESEEITEDEKLDDVEKVISQNIIALKAALEKVKNPAAKVALQRNIEKSYAKLARKMEKIAEKKKELEASKDFVPVEVKAESNVKVEAKEKVKAEMKAKAEAKAIAEAKAKAEASVVVEAQKVQPLKNKQTETKQKIKDMKNEHKSNVKQIKNEIKEVKKQVKQDVNIDKKVEKIENKLEKHIPVKIEKKNFDNKGSFHQENNWNHQGR
ncbi:DUF5667 domain-containing protein [Robertmurraya kyonggiensis]|uniref:DUF5667 domain-containing protein n=1 Tax=Robertmurraya kyonggiensis TaxID=1037680 RepID=A0A4U1D8Y2_9BACI|nr:DUF5667 domain-containing protein [Robertmurraya kyonggiensis]TKC18433.1 hypothetical protein FA727_02470 [Robertmurraya kyonggiensis]